MKAIFITSFLLISNTFYGQNHFNQWVLSGGTSYSFLRGIHKVPFRDYDKNFKFTVGGQFHADWGLIRRFSVGVGITHQRHHLTIQDYQYTLDNTVYTESPTQSVYVTGYYARVLIHLRALYESTGEEVDVYWGATQQFINYQSFNNSNDPNFHQFNQGIQSIPCAVGGIRYYPTDFFGVHAEASFPGMYTLSGGIAFRFKNEKRF